jgi:hypothetical protein
MAILFGKARSTVAEHIQNVFNEGEAKKPVKEMRKIFFLILSLSIVSCSRTNESKVQITVDSVKEKPLERIEKLTDIPSKTFEAIVQILDSLGYRSDTTRVKRLNSYPELTDSEIQLVGTFPFYKIDKEKAKVLWWNKIAREKGDSIDTEIFKKAERVWGYFYQKEEAPNVRTDGVIEQWEFADAGVAQNAMNKLAAIYPLPYFNTQPYYVTNGQFLFIFHTRASAFSYRQKEFFNKFKEISSASGNEYKSLPGLE